ncbi:glycosyltransferase family 4 protein [Chondromyces apiculatus]|uniref:glycosyltransferase family 4 protein n=1 Tax=Chondromyces apiculatus TaxID=51 RepID=UPI0005C4C981|nr:glycosyltransferase family 4 protein [Chondromyces apiculatus]
MNPQSPSQTSQSLRVLWVTRIFPNRVEPLACPFQRQQLAALSRQCDVEVLATIPYYPGAGLLGERTRPARLSVVPERDEIDGIHVEHPRAPYLPGAGKLLAAVNAPLYLGGLLPQLPRLRGRFDVVMGAFLYPDACAAAALARLLGIPYAVKGHGTDVNVVAQWPSVKPLVRAALRRASAAFGVSRPMVDMLVEMGAAPERTSLVMNGVNRSVFRPQDKLEARRALGLPEKARIITFVGTLAAHKGVRELVAALDGVAQASGDEPTCLVMVGDGPERHALEEEAARRIEAAGGQIVIPGPRPLEEVARYMAAGDIVTLPSHAEGTPNVILEALASGRPVVATNVGGIPDVIEQGRTGLLVPPEDVPALSEALRDALTRHWDEQEISAAAPPSWDESASRLRMYLERAAFGDSMPLAA